MIKYGKNQSSFSDHLRRYEGSHQKAQLVYYSLQRELGGQTLETVLNRVVSMLDALVVIGTVTVLDNEGKQITLAYSDNKLEINHKL